MAPRLVGGGAAVGALPEDTAAHKRIGSGGIRERNHDSDNLRRRSRRHVELARCLAVRAEPANLLDLGQIELIAGTEVVLDN